MVRRTSVLDNNSELEHMYTLKNVPSSMACVNTLAKNDIMKDQTWDICTKTGLIQLREPLSLELVYKFAHNDAYGKTWEKHHHALSDFAANFGIKDILEIGGASGKLGRYFLSKNQNTRWTMLEPNYNYEKVNIPNFTHIRKWFDGDYVDAHQYDAFIHSHVFEHAYNPLEFLNNIRNRMNNNSYNIFSIPSLYSFIEQCYVNALNFEHTLFITDDIVDRILSAVGFKVVNKHYHDNHSIFYACKKSEPIKVNYDGLYEKNKKVFINYINYHSKNIIQLNKKIQSCEGDVFLFGGHVFSQILIVNGLDTDKINCILDNSPRKQGLRLYGTHLHVKSPNILKGLHEPTVILKTGVYNEEIKNDILTNINKGVIFFE